MGLNYHCEYCRDRGVVTGGMFRRLAVVCPKCDGSPRAYFDSKPVPDIPQAPPCPPSSKKAVLPEVKTFELAVYSKQFIKQRIFLMRFPVPFSGLSWEDTCRHPEIPQLHSRYQHPISKLWYSVVSHTVSVTSPKTVEVRVDYKELSPEDLRWCEHFHIGDFGQWIYTVGNYVIFSGQNDFRIYDFKFCPQCGKPRPKETK